MRKNLIKLRAKPLVQVYGIYSEFYVTHQQFKVGSILTKLWYLVTIVILIVFTVKSNNTELFIKRAFNFLNLVEDRNNSVMAFFLLYKVANLPNPAYFVNHVSFLEYPIYARISSNVG